MSETVSLLRRLLNRDPQDLDVALRVARGEEVGEEALQSLRRAGILRKSEKSARPRVIPALLAPLLALEETLAQGGRKILLALQSRLRGSETPAERESVLEALYEELSQQRQKFKEHPDPQAESLLPVLRELRTTLESLDPEQADPGLVMGAASLAAELIEMIGKGLTPQKRKKVEREKLPKVSPQQIAALLPPAPKMPRLLRVPAALELAIALSGEKPPKRQPAGVKRELPVQPDRGAEVQSALGGTDATTSLYGGVDQRSAMERHTALAVLGRAGLSAADLISAVDEELDLGEVRVTPLKQRALLDLREAAA